MILEDCVIGIYNLVDFWITEKKEFIAVQSDQVRIRGSDTAGYLTFFSG